jgi:hypothetical protein
MSKKQWYVAAETFEGGYKQVIEYTGTKKEAENILKQINLNSNFKFPYIDFVWKQDILNQVPFSRLHGKRWIKINNILELIPVKEMTA